jgi:hypothetical protein
MEPTTGPATHAWLSDASLVSAAGGRLLAGVIDDTEEDVIVEKVVARGVGVSLGNSSLSKC